MEIREYWLALGHRRWALVIAPLLAGLLAFAAAAQRPGEHEATATVLLPSGGDTDNPPITRQLTSNVTAVLESDLVAAEVAEETGVPAPRIAERLSATRAGEGNLVEVRYRDTDAAQVENVAETAARVGLRLLLDGQDTEVEQFREAAQERYDGAQRDIDEFLAETELTNPTVEYQSAVTSLNNLRVQLITAQAGGDDDRASQLAEVIEAREEDLAQLGRQVRRFTPLSDAAGRVNAQLGSAEVQELTVAAQLATVEQASTVTTQAASPVPRLPAIMQLVGLAVVVSLLVVVGVLLLGAASTPPPPREEVAMRRRPRASSRV